MYHAMSRMLRGVFKRAGKREPSHEGASRRLLVHDGIEQAMQADLMLTTPSWVMNTPARLG